MIYLLSLLAIIIPQLVNDLTTQVNNGLRIAQCESNYGQNLYNPTSSAKGIFQFIDSTWENYCEGDVLDSEDNIRCFVELYPKHPTWWECK